jgi:sortase A
VPRERTGTHRRRRLGTILIALGIVVVAYGAVVWLWRDPVTDLYARWQQHRLEGRLEQVFGEFSLPPADAASASDDGQAEQAPSTAALQASVAAAARRTLAGLQLGQPLGKIDIPKLDIDPIFVNGTRWAQDLSRGPGRYPETSLPGLGKVTAIAGHRTTFGAWFRHIDKLQAGDPIILTLPYGTFHYRVVLHEIVPSDDWRIIEPRGYDALVLSACHPLYSASHRWVVIARLTQVDTGAAGSYAVARNSTTTPVG